ncbi:hypothetical protein TNCV_1602211 [Trichonephila clavipes]|nr:hypothetical protein TNCV_1602211 [Trichonephila clavipes]
MQWSGRCPCSFNTMPQLINVSDWFMVPRVKRMHQTFYIGKRFFGTCRQDQQLNIFRIKEGPYNTGNMRSCIILLKRLWAGLNTRATGRNTPEIDHQARRTFVESAQNEIAVVPDFHKRILFSDEAHFWLNGHVNKQNCRIWSEANPQVYVETPLHLEKLTVWCALWAGGTLLQKR